MSPSYYCPPGIDRPAHIRCRAPARQIGPDGKEGMIYGRPYDASEPWEQTDAGWWMCLAGVEPADLLRTNAMPGVTVGDWLVPHLIRLDNTSAVGFVGPSGFTVPRHIAPLIDRLRPIGAYTGPVQFEHAQLAADVLAINYHITLHEIGSKQWMQMSDVWPIIQGSYGFSREAIAQAAANG